MLFACCVAPMSMCKILSSFYPFHISEKQKPIHNVVDNVFVIFFTHKKIPNSFCFFFLVTKCINASNEASCAPLFHSKIKIIQHLMK